MNTDDKYGDINFMSFLGSVLARLAYFSDYAKLPNYFSSEPEEQHMIRSKNFISLYSCIFSDQVIPTTMLNSIGNQTNLDNLFNDAILFSNVNEAPKRANGYIDFIPIAKKVNVITGEESGTRDAKIVGQKINAIYNSGILKKGRVYYTSIGTSNYGEIYIVADLDIPNKLFVVFRGTYSSKTANAWSKPTSLVAWTVSEYNGKKQAYLYGIFKLVEDTLNTVLQACLDLSQKAFPNATTANAVSVITCGHSLGGAMSTIFSYLWMSVKENQLANLPPVNNSGKKNPYISGDFIRLSKQIGCVSLGSPRVFSKDLSILFCDYVKEKFIVYKRLTTRGDPFTGQPYFGFYHACSTSEEMRKEISEDCTQTLLRIGPAGANYEGKLDCKNVKTRTYAPDPFSHTIYLYILFGQALDYRSTKKMFAEMNEFGDSLKKTNKTSIFNFEVQREGSASMCRLLFYDGPMNVDGCKIAFFNLNNVRNNRIDDQAYENKVDAEQSAANNSQMASVGGGMFDWISKSFSSTKSTPVTTVVPVTPVVPVTSATSSYTPTTMATSQPKKSSYSSYFSSMKPSFSSSSTGKTKYQDVSEDVRITTPVFDKLKQISQFIPFMSIEREPMNYKDYPNAVLSIEDINSLAPLPLSQYIVIGKIHLPSSTNSTSLQVPMKGGAKRKSRKTRKSKKVRKMNKRKTKKRK